MFRQAYLEYLKSPAWQRKREWVLNFWGRRCALCNSREHLEVHHRTYERLGHELLTDMLPLCDRCHGLVYKVSQTRSNEIIYMQQLGVMNNG